MLYKVLSAHDLAGLTELVESLLQQGWTLVGGVAFDGNHYLQAMTRVG